MPPKLCQGIGLKQEWSLCMHVWVDSDSVSALQEALEVCQTRIFKMEQQQQGGQIEGVGGRVGCPLLGKLISVLLALSAVLLVCISAGANCTVPLLKTRTRALCSLLLLLLLALLWQNWDTLMQYLDHLLELYV